MTAPTPRPTRPTSEPWSCSPSWRTSTTTTASTLYRWGREERDPRNCDLERTQDLWRAAHERFRLALEHAEPASELSRAAQANRHAMNAHLAEIARLIAEPPPECGSSGGGSEAASQNEGKSESTLR